MYTTGTLIRVRSDDLLFFVHYESRTTGQLSVSRGSVRSSVKVSSVGDRLNDPLTSYRFGLVLVCSDQVYPSRRVYWVSTEVSLLFTNNKNL